MQSSFIQKVEKGRPLKTMRQQDQDPPNTVLWVSFALTASIGYAVSNTFVGEIAILGGVIARVYYNFGDLAGSFAFLAYESQKSVQQGNGRWGWYFDSFYKRRDSLEKPLLGIARQPKRKIMKLRVLNMAICGILDLCVYFFFVKSYNLAHYAHLN